MGLTLKRIDAMKRMVAKAARDTEDDADGGQHKSLADEHRW